MNKIYGKISNIESEDYISIVEINTEIGNFFSLIVETPKTADYLKKGKEINILFKETEVEILKNCFLEKNLNTFEGKILNMKKGKVLSKLVIEKKDLKIVSILTTKAVEILGIKENEKIYFYVKPNEIVIEAL